MLLSYRDPQFWKSFHARHWQPRVPTVIRRPFKAFPFSEEMLLRSLNVYAERLQGGDHRIPCLVSVGDKERAPRRPLRELFRERSESLKQVEENCARIFPKQNFGLMITQMQAVDPGIWGALTAFLQDSRRWIGPAPNTHFDLFYGNYSSSFTGVHKDTQDIIAFVVRGEKRILAWPFDYFLPMVEGLSRADRFFNRRLAIDPRKYRKDAVILEARAGDVIYWPSDYWHVSEVQKGGFSAMLSLGLEQRAVIPSKLAPEERAALVSQEMTDAITRPDAARQLRWITGFAFEQGGPIADIGEPLEGNVRVVKRKSSVILWKIDMSRRRILVASNGHSITLPHSSKLLKLLERIAQGESVTLSTASQRDRDAPYEIFETNWNKHCELKTRKLTSRRDPGVRLVDWLLRVYAVEKVQRKASTLPKRN